MYPQVIGLRILGHSRYAARGLIQSRFWSVVKKHGAKSCAARSMRRNLESAFPLQTGLRLIENPARYYE
jgi:hypothetical protein